MPGYGFGYRFSRRHVIQIGNPASGTEILYGPHYGPKGPKQVIYAVWNQGDTGYCLETQNRAENLPAKWASRGINCWKPGHPDVTLQGRAQQMLAAVKAAGLMMIAAPKWEPDYAPRPDLAALDFRDLAINDPYWRSHWIAYQISDEPDLSPWPMSTHLRHANNMKLDGITKPTLANFTSRVANPATGLGSSTINFYEAFNAPELVGLSIDRYEWHSDAALGAVAATPYPTGPRIWVSPWNSENQPGWPRFTGSATGLSVYIMRNGPLSPGRSDTGQMPVQYPPSDFNTPPGATYGLVIPPQPHTYAPGDKATGHYVATGRVDISTGTFYAGAGKWQPGRFLRSEGWSGFVHGSSSLYIFPQTVGFFTVTGYIDAAANTLHVTAPPLRPIDGAMDIRWDDPADTDGYPTIQVGSIRRDNPQISGTPNGVGVYALDPAIQAPVSVGSAGSPVVMGLSTEAKPWGDDTNPENLAELTTLIANINRMQAHPTGGNLMIDTALGGRREFAVMRCPEIDGDAGLYMDDMTRAPIRAGYTSGGAPIPDAAGMNPMWELGWPMGFEGFRVLGDDGAWYLYVRSMSNGDAPTWFPGFAALGLPARVFRSLEVVGFRRVGTETAVEMTGSSGIIKAGVDDGAATWFWIESSAISQNEGNSGNTAYVITVRRGGDVSGTNTVTAAAWGAGVNPANASDFAGGAFPSEVLSFAANETTKTFTVNAAGDASAEQNETFAVRLSSPSGGAALVASGKSAITCTIINDDAPVVGAFIWLGASLTAAPALPGAPVDATWLNSSESTFVTRAGITMRAVGAGFATNASGFASVPLWGMDNLYHGVELQLAAGDWEIGVIAVTDGPAGGPMEVIDDPAGTATVRYSFTFPSASPARIIDTDGTQYTDPVTAVADAVSNLTFVPVTVRNLGSGVGRLRFVGGAPAVLLSAIALREVR